MGIAEHAFSEFYIKIKTWANPNDGTEPYELTTDWWKGHVEREVGPNYGRLLQLYGVHKAMREAAKKHLRVSRRQETDGSIRLTLAA